MPTGTNVQVMSTMTSFPVSGEPRTIVGTTVRMLLVRDDKTQTDLAVQMGLSQSQLSKRIRGTIAFDLDELVFLADYFNVSVGLLFGEMQTTPQPSGPGGGGGARYAITDSNREPADLGDFRLSLARVA